MGHLPIFNIEYLYSVKTPTKKNERSRTEQKGLGR